MTSHKRGSISPALVVMWCAAVLGLAILMLFGVIIAAAIIKGGIQGLREESPSAVCTTPTPSAEPTMDPPKRRERKP